MAVFSSFSFVPHPKTGQPVPHPQILHQMGPVLPVQIQLPQNLAKSLAKPGSPLPPPVNGFALIDTGAGSSCAHEPALLGLGLKPVGIANVAGVGGLKQHSLYPASFAFPGTPLPIINFSQVIGVDLAAQNMGGAQIVALLGRDILAGCVLVYNGTAGTFSISF